MVARSMPRAEIPPPLLPLLEAVRSRLNPVDVWLFGSRARGDNTPDSDWDLLVLLPDDAGPELLDPLVGWTIRQEVGIPATVLTTTVGEFQRFWGSPNTLGYELARDGIRLAP